MSKNATRTEKLDTVVIGGGQAGLSAGYYLKKQDRSFVILDSHPRVGDAWRRRWDSLLLFTPARINGLPGMKMPFSGDTFIKKDEIADFLESYARNFDLPVMTSTRVERLAKNGERFVVETSKATFEAQNVIVAMANFQKPRIPAFASELDADIFQVHSHDYRNADQLKDGGVLVVGLGNSGADIGLEVAQSHPTWIAGKETATVPFRIETFIARHLLIRMVRFVGHHVLTIRTPIGRRIRPKFMASGNPLVRVKPRDLTDAGATRVGRIAGVRNGLPVTEDGEALDVKNVVWCTGYGPGFYWIDIPIFGANQEPDHKAGIVEKIPGLYFLGLKFMYSATSDTVTGVQRDARRITRHLRANRPKWATGTTSLKRAQEKSPVK
jgi:putative flavoprotein involved in K+ transport